MDHNSTCLLCRALDRWPGLAEWTQIQDAYWDVHRGPEKQRKHLTVKGECSLVSLSGSRMSPEKGIRIQGTRQTGKSGSQTKSSSKGCKSQPGPRDENEEGFYSSCQYGRATRKYFSFLLSLCLLRYLSRENLFKQSLLICPYQWNNLPGNDVMTASPPLSHQSSCLLRFLSLCSCFAVKVFTCRIKAFSAVLFGPLMFHFFDLGLLTQWLLQLIVMMVLFKPTL